jgi:hypothetical protein
LADEVEVVQVNFPGGSAGDANTDTNPMSTARFTRSVLPGAVIFEVTKQRRLLKLTQSFCIFASAVTLMGAGAFIGAGMLHWLLFVMVVFAGLIAKVGASAGAQASSMFLEVGTAGIAYSLIGWHLVVPWERVVSIGRVVNVPGSVNGLVLDEPVQVPGRLFGRRVSIRAVPLDQFDPNWRTHGPLGVELRRFVPHLFPGQATS